MKDTTNTSPVGKKSTEASSDRALRSSVYRDARAEYAYIHELRKVSPLAAHLRERRFELGLTQVEVANAAKTSHTGISRIERGESNPRIATLQKVGKVLGEDLYLCFESSNDEDKIRAIIPLP